jgi:GxxExxY protein
MTENQISNIVVNAAFEIHKTLGPGLFESVYEAILYHELMKDSALLVHRQITLPVIWENIKLEPGFRCDIIIDHKVILEIKAIDKLAPVHAQQLLTYLKLTNIKLGLLINFNEALLKNGIKRVVNGL